MLTRRQFLHAGASLLFARLPAPDPLDIGPGPHLFLDDYLVERMEGLEREIQHPTRHPEPVLDSARFGTTQPYLSVLRDPESDRFRIWYNRGPAIWHAESADGIRWENPRVAWDLPRNYGASLIDDGRREADPGRRFKAATWQATRAREDKPGDDGGMYVGFSPDGFRWSAHPGNPVLPTWPEGWPKVVRHGVGDTVDVAWDPLRKRYLAAVEVHALPEDDYAPAPKAGRMFRRLVGISSSTDFIRWEKPERIFVPDERDEGLLEFYGMGAIHARGPLLIGMLRVLRDDLPCDPGGPVEGIGYTALAFSRDGAPFAPYPKPRWERFRAPFLDRRRCQGPSEGHPQGHPPGWDHAMAWISGALPVGNELHLYYGGYARGHKVAPDRERQIGLARLKKDRYLALAQSREAARGGKGPGILRTRAFVLPGGRLTLNADARGGEVRVRLLDASGTSIPGFDWRDAAPLTADALAAEVRWNGRFEGLKGRVVRLEFLVRQARLFGFEFHDG